MYVDEILSSFPHMWLNADKLNAELFLIFLNKGLSNATKTYYVLFPKHKTGFWNYWVQPYKEELGELILARTSGQSEHFQNKTHILPIVI